MYGFGVAQLYGDDGDDEISTNGHDRVIGGLGRDTIYLNGGSNVVEMHPGEVSGDLIAQVTPTDRFELIGFGPDASIASMGADNWQVSYGDTAEQFRVFGAVSAEQFDFF